MIILVSLLSIPHYYAQSDMKILHCDITMLKFDSSTLYFALPVFCHPTTVPHCGITILLCVITILNYNNKLLNYDIIAIHCAIEMPNCGSSVICCDITKLISQSWAETSWCFGSTSHNCAVTVFYDKATFWQLSS